MVEDSNKTTDDDMLQITSTTETPQSAKIGFDPFIESAIQKIEAYDAHASLKTKLEVILSRYKKSFEPLFAEFAEARREMAKFANDQ